MRRVTEMGPDKVAQGVWGVQDLRERPAPMQTGGKISLAQLAVDNFALGTGGSAINFATINDAFDASDRFDLTGGGDLEINGAGIYALHFNWFGLATTTGKNCQLFVNADVISGSNGLWSSGTTGDDMDGTFAANITTPGTDISGEAEHGIQAFVAWATTDTFPVVIQFNAQYTEDGIGIAKSPDFRLTAIRLGAGDE